MAGIERMDSEWYNWSFEHADWHSHRPKFFIRLNMGGHVEESSRTRPIFGQVMPTLHASPTLIGIEVEPKESL